MTKLKIKKVVAAILLLSLMAGLTAVFAQSASISAVSSVASIYCVEWDDEEVCVKWETQG